MGDKQIKTDMANPNLLEMTAEIVSSFVTNNSIPARELPNLIKTIHTTIAGLTEAGEQASPRPEPAVPVSRSISDDYIICLEDGRKLKMLKRYLRSRYDLTPEEYRSRWNLPADYPMVAPNYARKRSEFAKQIGLGRKKTGQS